jgi:hypothetical protein
MTESTPNEPSIPDDPATPADDNTAAPAPGRRRLMLVLVGVVAAALLVAAAVIFVIRQPTRAEVGQCIKETDVVSCAEPHDARIVQIVSNANDCAPPATNVFKEADGRYLCVVDEAG